jgi:hypothetical protein
VNDNPRRSSGNNLPRRTSVEDAIRDQLDTAIKLWFEEGPITPIEALTYNALRRLHDLANVTKRGRPSAMISHILKLPKERREMVMLPFDFAKHGDRRMKDIEAVDSRPDLIEHFTYEAVTLYAGAFHDLTLLMRLFAARYALDNAVLFRELGMPQFEKLIMREYDFAGLTRGEFLKKFHPVLTDLWIKDGWSPPPP